MNFGSRFLEGHRPGHSAYLVRRLREAGFVVVGITNMPEFGILPTTEPRHTGADPQPVGPRAHAGRLLRRLGGGGGRRAWCRSRTATTAAARSASRPPARGLVGLKPSRGRDLARARPRRLVPGLRRRAHAHGRRRPPQLLDVLAGYEVGDATWAPRPAEPYATAVRRDPGRLRIAMTAANPLEVDVDPECVRGMHQAGELLASLGHEVEEAGPAHAGQGRARPVRRASSGRPWRSASPTASCSPAARRRTTRSSRCRARSTSWPSETHLGRLPRRGRPAAGAGARRSWRSSPATTSCSRPALAERPLAIGDCNGLGEQPMARPRALRALHALHVAVQRHRPARDHGPDRLRRGQPADHRADRRQAARRGHAAAGRRPDRDRPPLGAPAPARAARPAPSTSAIRRGRTPSASRSAAPRAREHRHGEHQRLVPGRERRRAGQRLAGPQQRRAAPRAASGTSRRRRPAARSTSSTTSRWVSSSGPASSSRSWPCGPRSSAATTPSAASSAHSGCVRAAPRPVSGTAGSSASRSSRASRRSPGA